MPYRAAAAAFAALLFALGLVVLWPPATQAQPTPPPATPAPALTPEPTRSVPDPGGVGAGAEGLGALVARYGWLGALGLLLVGGAAWLLSGYGEGIREEFKEGGKRATEGAGWRRDPAANAMLIVGASSPCSSRSAITRRARAWACAIASS